MSKAKASINDRIVLIVSILRLCYDEGEDIPFRNILDILEKTWHKYSALIRELRRKYGELPPRVAISLMLRDSLWRDAVVVGCRKYLKELLQDNSIG